MQFRTRIALEGNLSYRLSILNFLMGKATHEIYSAQGLSSHQWKVLSVLDAFAPMPAREILKWVTLDKAAISRAVQQLRALELADYRPHDSDGRFIDIVLTPKGRRVYRKMNENVAKLQAHVLAGMSPQQQDGLFELIDALESGLRSELASQPTPRRAARASAGG